MPRISKPGAWAHAAALILMAQGLRAAESIEVVAEHLPEIAMDNRYASLPLWSRCDVDDNDTKEPYCFGVNAGYAWTHSATLSIDGPMISLSTTRPIGEEFQLTGFVFFDDFALASGQEQRLLEVRFTQPPLTLPAQAEFSGLDGDARDMGFGAALRGSAHWNWLPWFEWSAGLMWQTFKLSDYRFDYRITDGPDAGTAGILDYSATYTHISPFFGAAWPRSRGVWHYVPHVHVALPLPRRALEGRISGPGFDLAGNTADNGAGKHFGDASVTIGFDLTYEPWDFTVDLGSTITQALLEPRIHEGVEHNLMLSACWMF